MEIFSTFLPFYKVSKSALYMAFRNKSRLFSSPKSFANHYSYWHSKKIMFQKKSTLQEIRSRLTLFYIFVWCRKNEKKNQNLLQSHEKRAINFEARHISLMG